MPPAQTSNTPTPLYRNYVLFMLTIVYVFNFIDRQVLVILQESIKKELHLSDSLLGWLSGFAFAIFYVTLGLPIARFADKTSRRTTVAVSLGLWSIMSTLTGTAGNFIQLLLARVGVGVGEAGGSPPAHAMISDYFPPKRRSTALAIYSSGIYVGVLIGFVLGGYLSQHFGWRRAFFVVSSPGIIFALLFYATVKEPRRGATDPDAIAANEHHPLRTVLKRLYSSKTFVYLCMATALHVFCIYGLMNWAASFLGRSHGMTVSQRGAALGLALGIGGAIGSFAGGALTDRFGKRDIRWYMKLPAYAILLSVFFVAGALFLNDNSTSVICFGCVAALQSSYLGPSIAVAHSLVPASMRALTSAILFFVLNLIGQGFGPWVVGILSDSLAPGLGAQSLRWAMSINMAVAIASMILFFKTAKTLSPTRRSP
ncbi:MAG TPA: MFS transporter [Puia sp.]|nr:MFS transporter [Puia sp.]